jgi:uncharacterized membrane protein
VVRIESGGYQSQLHLLATLISHEIAVVAHSSSRTTGLMNGVGSLDELSSPDSCYSDSCYSDSCYSDSCYSDSCYSDSGHSRVVHLGTTVTLGTLGTLDIFSWVPTNVVAVVNTVPIVDCGHSNFG